MKSGRPSYSKFERPCCSQRMGLVPQDVDVAYCSEVSGEILDTHELGELLDTVDNNQRWHERRVSATAGNRVQTGGDDADERQPIDEVTINCNGGASNGGDAHVGMRSHAQEHTRHKTPQNSEEIQGPTEDRGCVLGLGGTGWH